MNGKLNNKGLLEIYRAPYRAHQGCACPFNTTTMLHNLCGDWCALFGEPELVINEEKHTKRWQLNLCHRTLIFDEFTDKRKEEGEK